EILKVEIVDESDRSKDMRATAIMINKREMLE
ncbi:MAG: hypothetical protein ACI8VT_004383, partial [Saprospiraceae bacterium]